MEDSSVLLVLPILKVFPFFVGWGLPERTEGLMHIRLMLHTDMYPHLLLSLTHAREKEKATSENTTKITSEMKHWCRKQLEIFSMDG
jgi:hypothetical protein